jgi:hypothetical protein
MIPFDRAWPYEILGKDIYVRDCPFCSAENVLLPLRKAELVEIREGKKKLLVFPCCFNKVKLVDTDSDYLLADQPLRKKH